MAKARSRGGVRWQLTEESYRRMEALFLAGASVNQVATAEGCSYGVAERALKTGWLNRHVWARPISEVLGADGSDEPAGAAGGAGVEPPADHAQEAPRTITGTRIAYVPSSGLPEEYSATDEAAAVAKMLGIGGLLADRGLALLERLDAHVDKHLGSAIDGPLLVRLLEVSIRAAKESTVLVRQAMELERLRRNQPMFIGESRGGGEMTDAEVDQVFNLAARRYAREQGLQLVRTGTDGDGGSDGGSDG